MPETKYHGDELKDYVSGSVLWEFYNKCPAEQVYGERKESESLVTGSACHSEVLEMHSFDDLYYRGFEPTEKTLTSDAAVKSKLKSIGVTGYSNKTGRALWDMLLEKEPDSLILKDQEEHLEKENNGKELLKFSVYDMAKDMRQQLMSYNDYSDKVTNGLCESSIIGEMEINGHIFNVKTKPDIIHNNCIINYKTTNSVKPDDIIRDCFRFGYFMKEYFNAIVFERMFGYFPEVLILAQSKKKPYVCTGIKLTEEQLSIGAAQFNEALALYKACKDAEVYVDYAQGAFLEVETPSWMFSKIAN